MSEAKHTPGPWWSSSLEVGTAPMMLVKVARVSGANHEEALANARLIAAAPELLNALQDLMASISGGKKSCGHEFTCVCPGEKARAAIAKATGGAA